MSETKQIDGPWEAIAEAGDENFKHSIYGEGFKGLLIARCNQNGRYDEHAALIAAAPDLLEACRCALGHLTGNMDGDMDLGDPVEKLRAAISKAEGSLT